MRFHQHRSKQIRAIWTNDNIIMSHMGTYDSNINVCRWQLAHFIAHFVPRMKLYFYSNHFSQVGYH